MYLGKDDAPLIYGVEVSKIVSLDLCYLRRF
jgi:hypothetical protein